jgi:hypothetical protein
MGVVGLRGVLDKQELLLCQLHQSCVEKLQWAWAFAGRAGEAGAQASCL